MLPIETLRRTLLDQRVMLLKRVAHAEEDLLWLDNHVAAESVEEGQEENIARLLTRLDDRGRAELAEIDAALSRLALGDYGRCDGCGEAIPAKRLQAMPTTTHCLACAQNMEGPKRQR